VSRHFLAWIDTLLTDGFREIHDYWTGRREEGDEVSVYDRGRRLTGAFKLVNAGGDLVFGVAGGEPQALRIADQATRIAG